MPLTAWNELSWDVTPGNCANSSSVAILSGPACDAVTVTQLRDILGTNRATQIFNNRTTGPRFSEWQQRSRQRLLWMACEMDDVMFSAKRVEALRGLKRIVATLLVGTKSTRTAIEHKGATTLVFICLSPMYPSAYVQGGGNNFYHFFSPCIVITSLRECFIARNSANCISCHCLSCWQQYWNTCETSYPNANRPSLIGMLRLDPSRMLLTCEGISSGPSALCLYNSVGLSSRVFSGAIRSIASLRSKRV